MADSEDNGAPSPDQDGGPDRRRTSLAELANGPDLIRAILDSSPIATMAFDRDQNLTFWSSAAQRVFGWGAAEVLGGPMPGLAEDELASAAERNDRLLAASVVRGDRVRRHSRDGRELVLEIYGGPLRDTDGAVGGFAGQIIDITNREQSRIQLERLGAAMDQAIDGVAVTDDRGVIVYVTPHMKSSQAMLRRPRRGQARDDRRRHPGR